VHVVNRQSFHWGMSLHMPWESLVVLSIALLGASVATTLVSGRQAMSRDVIQAVKDDW
jgi:putative ABC transport system permease protein